MTWLTIFFGGLLLLVSGLAVAAQRRYLTLLRKYQGLQQRYDKAEQQLTTFWNSKQG